MQTKQAIEKALAEVVEQLGVQDAKAVVDIPSQTEHGDYSTNVAMILGKRLGKNPMEIAQQIAADLKSQNANLPAGEAGLKSIEKIEVAPPGFINFLLNKESLLENLQQSSNLTIEPSYAKASAGKRIMVEFAHPNTHKEMHIGHMRTLITGESISRLLEASGATVFRANYQGDIGPHVAKALYGIQKIMEEKKLALSIVEGWDNKAKAHFLGEGYVKGSKEYEEHKEEIDSINTALYEGLVILSASEGSHLAKDSSSSTQNDILSLYQRTRQWSLDYYDEFYTRFYTHFDKLFFESEVVASGKKIVEENIGKVFTRENGAVIFKGEKYNLHTRVFITQAGNPTYEGKEMGNAYAEYEAFPFDLKMHIVASEQAGYFQVVFKALDLIDPAKFEGKPFGNAQGKQHHLSMGMVTLTDRKMSSRTGDILTVDWLIDQVKAKVGELAKEGKISSSPSPQSPKATAPSPQSGEGNKEEADVVVEMITIGAIKYSVLKGGAGQNVAFDIEKSVALDGNSGPYLQYTFARTRSVLTKGREQRAESKAENTVPLALSSTLEVEETQLLRRLYQFDEIVQEAAGKYAPNVLCTYLYQLAAEFNLFYQKHKILPPVILNPKGEESPKKDPSSSTQDDNVTAFRLALTQSVGNTLQKGLELLGIKAPEKM